MSPAVILFLIVVSTTLAGSVTIKTLVFSTETSTNYVEMIPQRPMNLRSFTLCMRVATELSGRREVILFAYRTRNYDELHVWRELDGRLSFYLAGDPVLFKVPELGALQTHLCITWDSTSGLAALFLDGKRSLSKIYRKGHTVRAGGRVILGQDPDSFLGDFDSDQSFVGEIFDVNMWDTVLADSVIQGIFAGKREPRGNVLDWERTELRINGDVKVATREL
ncbi:pentraxin fusion protein-like [Astatotilapia calliptera]|uniref:Pentraxin family member n=1 Tax=Astatotilapia calliptera TaxID=8154 RepID=A0A3P8QIZ1_ASTCA|nr:pentraxin fusion protein-like [Astatotilapia calliptera]